MRGSKQVHVGNTLGASIRPNNGAQHNPDWQSACNATPSPSGSTSVSNAFSFFLFPPPPAIRFSFLAARLRSASPSIPTESQISLHLLCRRDSIELTLRCSPALPAANRFTSIRVIRLWRWERRSHRVSRLCTARACPTDWYFIGVTIQALISMGPAGKGDIRVDCEGKGGGSGGGEVGIGELGKRVEMASCGKSREYNDRDRGKFYARRRGGGVFCSGIK